jgi:hypothetical protein
VKIKPYKRTKIRLSEIKCCEEFNNALKERVEKSTGRSHKQHLLGIRVVLRTNSLYKTGILSWKKMLGKITSEAIQSLMQKHAETNVKTSTINPLLLPNETNEVEINESKIHSRTPYKKLSRVRKISSAPNIKSDLLQGNNITSYLSCKRPSVCSQDKQHDQRGKIPKPKYSCKILYNFFTRNVLYT